MDEPASIDIARIANELKLAEDQVINVTALLDEGNTVPFITRYRKERTGNLDEEQIRQIEERVAFRRQLAERARTIIRLIDAQGKLTPQLQREIERAESLKRLDDLYLPFRPKRQSRAEQARQRGLEPLAERVWKKDSSLGNLLTAATEFVNPENELPDANAVLRGCSDILAERISDDAEVRKSMRQIAWKTGKLVVAASKAGEETGKEYRDYFAYSEMVSKIPPHRVLALNRGEKAGALRVKFEWEDAQADAAVRKHYQLDEQPYGEFLQSCAADALHRLIQPSFDREVRRELTETAEAHAVSVFSRNLRNLLLQPPMQGRRVLAIDPGFRTGCKIALLDETGHCLATDVIYLTGPDEKKAGSRKKLSEFLAQHECKLIAIGNGTACRETEELVAEMIGEHAPDTRYFIVNEAGASIYSTSAVAREEFPDADATVRGTISIGRRVQDPLSELVKIDPQHIGVGMYQHDVSTKSLKDSLDHVVESCVNYVGVDLNTASASLLRHVSGLNQLIARRVVEWREQHGPFRSRRQLLEVTGIGESTFTQAAGFLKVNGGDEPLDVTWIHPESYDVSRKLIARLDLPPADLIVRKESSTLLQERLAQFTIAELAGELQVGVPTLTDILHALSRPGRDPRTDSAGPVFKQGVLKLDDLTDGIELRGTVLNVVDFGVFVDIGVKDSGLVHISQLSTRFVKSPHEVVAVGDVVTVWVLGVDRERKRVALTMIKPGTPRESEQRKQQPAPTKPAPRPVVARPADNLKPETAGPKAPSKPQPRPPKQRAATPEPPLPKLSQDMVEGTTPLRGFDELKALWKKRNE